MPGNEYKYYRNRRIKRNIFVGLLFLLIVIIISFFICNSGGGNFGRRNGDIGIPGKSSVGSSEGSGMTSEGGENFEDSREGEGLHKKTGTGTSGKRKTSRRKTSSVEHPVINKVKKVKSEKNLPPKSPTLEIIGDEGKVLMKKE